MDNNNFKLNKFKNFNFNYNLNKNNKRPLEDNSTLLYT